MSQSVGVSPTSEEVETHIRSIAKRHPNLVRISKMCSTPEGRGIYAVRITDPKAFGTDKQNVVVTAGQHGNEESSRMVALALIDWLVSPEARKTRRNQCIVVMPNVNPDGAEQDMHGTPRGTMPNHDHGRCGAKTPEGLAVEKIFDAAMPELYLDLHARGGAGCSFDMTLWPPTSDYSEDEGIIHAISQEMAAAGEAVGIPQVNHPLAWWTGGDTDSPSTTVMAYRKFKSIMLLTENSEHNDCAYPAKLRAESGLAKIRAALEWGNRRHSKFYYSGYPCYLIGASYSRGIVAIGRTAAARRRSRVDLWDQEEHIEDLRIVAPEQLKHRELGLKYTGKTLPAGAGLQIRAQGRRTVKAVYLNGRKLRASETNGYYTWKDNCSTFVVAAVKPLKRRRYKLAVDFK